MKGPSWIIRRILHSKVSISKYQKHVEYRLTVDTMFFVSYSIGIMRIGGDEPAPVIWSPRRGGANGETGMMQQRIAVGFFVVRRTEADPNAYRGAKYVVTRVSSIAARFYTRYQE
jgi:hypothetical protein